MAPIGIKMNISTSHQMKDFFPGARAQRLDVSLSSQDVSGEAMVPIIVNWIFWFEIKPNPIDYNRINGLPRLDLIVEKTHPPKVEGSRAPLFADLWNEIRHGLCSKNSLEIVHSKYVFRPIRPLQTSGENLDGPIGFCFGILHSESLASY